MENLKPVVWPYGQEGIPFTSKKGWQKKRTFFCKAFFVVSYPYLQIPFLKVGVGHKVFQRKTYLSRRDRKGYKKTLNLLSGPTGRKGYPFLQKKPYLLSGPTGRLLLPVHVWQKKIFFETKNGSHFLSAFHFLFQKGFFFVYFFCFKWYFWRDTSKTSLQK